MDKIYQNICGHQSAYTTQNSNPKVGALSLLLVNPNFRKSVFQNAVTLFVCLGDNWR